MNLKQRAAGLVLAVLLILSLLPTAAFGAALPFTDVPSGAWYYSDVQGAYDTGLINGRTATTFAPEANMTYAEAVKLAACMHQKYTTGSVTLTNGTHNWWDSYVDYAKANGIITKDYARNGNATRAGYVEIFAYALPEEALKEKKTIAEGYIPDVGSTHPQAAEIYKLYRAGILTGMDEIGTFMPNSSIRRSEVSAILTRMMNEEARKSLIVGTSFTVTFNSNGGSAVEAQTVPMNGKAAQPVDPTLADYGFVGWCIDSTTTKLYDFSTLVTRDLTLYAKWTPLSDETYTVSFVSNSGTPVTPQQVKGFGKAVKPADPTRPNMRLEYGTNKYKVYDFAGWYQDKDLTKLYDFDALVKGNLTLYAKWTEQTTTLYEVSFWMNSRIKEQHENYYKVDLGEYVTQWVEENHKATRPEDPVKEGRTFSGWYQDCYCTTPFDFDAPITEETWIYAKWNDHIVYFEGKDAILDTQWVYHGETVKEPKAERFGYDLECWCTDSALTVPYDFSSPVTEDLILYPKWKLSGTIQDSWDDIIASVQDGTYKAKYKIGDTKFLEVEQQLAEPGGMVEMQIVAFDADELADGSGKKAAITWVAKQVLGEHRMEPAEKGNWENSEMRSWLNTNLKAWLPENVQAAIQPVKKYTFSYAADGTQIQNAVTTDALWIPSAYEIIGPSPKSYVKWENMGPVYTGLFNSEEARIKYDKNGKAMEWWLRSASDTTTSIKWYMTILETDGRDFYWSGTSKNGIVLGFCT